MKKRVLMVLLLVSIGLSLIFAAGQKEVTRLEGEKRLIKIAYSVDVLDETQQTVVDIFNDRVKELNETRTDIQVELVTYNAQGSVDKQISDVRTAIIKQPDVLIFSAVDTTGSLPAAQDAKDAGILIIDRRPVDPEPDVYDVAFYAYDEVRYSQATKDWLKGHLEKNPGKTLYVGLIYGAPAQVAQLRRCDVVKELAREMPDRVKVVAEGYGNWQTATAQNLAQDWLLAHPEMNCIVSANDIMALGASNAVVNANKKDRVLISGYDLTDDGIQRIREGTQDFDTGVNLADNWQIIDVAVDLVLGNFKEKTYYINPVYGVTRETLDDYLSAIGN